MVLFRCYFNYKVKKKKQLHTAGSHLNKWSGAFVFRRQEALLLRNFKVLCIIGEGLKMTGRFGERKSVGACQGPIGPLGGLPRPGPWASFPVLLSRWLSQGYTSDTEAFVNQREEKQSPVAHALQHVLISGSGMCWLFAELLGLLCPCGALRRTDDTHRMREHTSSTIFLGNVSNIWPGCLSIFALIRNYKDCMLGPQCPDIVNYAWIMVCSHCCSEGCSFVIGAGGSGAY